MGFPFQVGCRESLLPSCSQPEDERVTQRSTEPTKELHGVGAGAHDTGRGPHHLCTSCQGRFLIPLIIQASLNQGSITCRLKCFVNKRLQVRFNLKNNNNKSSAIREKCENHRSTDRWGFPSELPTLMT